MRFQVNSDFQELFLFSGGFMRFCEEMETRHKLEVKMSESRSCWFFFLMKLPISHFQFNFTKWKHCQLLFSGEQIKKLVLLCSLNLRLLSEFQQTKAKNKIKNPQTNIMHLSLCEQWTEMLCYNDVCPLNITLIKFGYDKRRGRGLKKRV